MSCCTTHDIVQLTRDSAICCTVSKVCLLPGTFYSEYTCSMLTHTPFWVKLPLNHSQGLLFRREQIYVFCSPKYCLPVLLAVVTFKHNVVINTVTIASQNLIIGATHGRGPASTNYIMVIITTSIPDLGWCCKLICN